MVSCFIKLIKNKLRNFLAINDVCYLPDEQFYAAVASRLLVVPRIFGNKDHLTIGHGVVLNDALINTSSGTVTLEEYAFCGHGVSLLTGIHDYTKFGELRQYAIPESGRDILIKKGVWLGSNSTVIGPCVIGENAVVAAGAIVVSNLEGNAIYAGVPAKKIKDLGKPTDE